MPRGVWKLLRGRKKSPRKSQKEDRQRPFEETRLRARSKEPNSARLDLRRFRSRTRIVEIKKETRPFPALPAGEEEDEEFPDPAQDGQDKPDYGGGPDDGKPPGATAFAAVATNQ